jgi:superfamily II DNA/RNA helicase
MKPIKCWIWICERCKKDCKAYAKKQTDFVFSATMPIAIRELAEMFLTKPETVTVSPVSSTAENEQRVYFVEKLKKRIALYNLLLTKIYQMYLFSQEQSTVLIMWSKRYVNEIFQPKQYMEINLRMLDNGC